MDPRTPVAVFTGALAGLLLVGLVPLAPSAVSLATSPMVQPVVVTSAVASAPIAPTARWRTPTPLADYGAGALADTADADVTSEPSASWSWSAAALVGLVPAVAMAAFTSVRRRSPTESAPIAVDLEAGSRSSMALNAKKGLHPEMFEAPVYCGGEQVMVTTGTKKEYIVDVWSGNHPFYLKKGGSLAADAQKMDKYRSKFEKFGGMGALGEIPTNLGPAVMLKLEPKAKKKAPGKK